MTLFIFLWRYKIKILKYTELIGVENHIIYFLQKKTENETKLDKCNK
jgi:hypothetical protein